MMNNNELDKVIEKIRKLHAKATAAGGTDAEAATFAAKAQELLERHNLTLTDIEIEQERSSMVQEEMHGREYAGKDTQRRNTFAEGILGAIARHNGVYPLVTQGTNKLTLIGRASQVSVVRNIVAMVYGFATSERNRAAAEYRRDNGTSRNFTHWWNRGFLLALHNRLEEQREAAQEAKRDAAANTQSYALIVQDDLEAAEVAAHQMFERIGAANKSRAGRREFNEDAIIAGGKAARRAPINRQVRA